jgi:hypothetical protein
MDQLEAIQQSRESRGPSTIFPTGPLPSHDERLADLGYGVKNEPVSPSEIDEGSDIVPSNSMTEEEIATRRQRNMEILKNQKGEKSDV